MLPTGLLSRLDNHNIRTSSKRDGNAHQLSHAQHDGRFSEGIYLMTSKSWCGSNIASGILGKHLDLQPISHLHEAFHSRSVSTDLSHISISSHVLLISGLRGRIWDLDFLWKRLHVHADRVL